MMATQESRARIPFLRYAHLSTLSVFLSADCESVSVTVHTGRSPFVPFPRPVPAAVLPIAASVPRFATDVTPALGTIIVFVGPVVAIGTARRIVSIRRVRAVPPVP